MFTNLNSRSIEFSILHTYVCLIFPMAPAESHSSLSYNTATLISFSYKQYTSSRLIWYKPKIYMISTQTINST